MPYIKPEDRLETFFEENLTREDIGVALGKAARNAGDFNYMISTAMAEYLRNNGLNYTNCNELHGMLDCCSKELYRRVTALYEDEKIDENGDCGYDELLEGTAYIDIEVYDKLY